MSKKAIILDVSLTENAGEDWEDGLAQLVDGGSIDIYMIKEEQYSGVRLSKDDLLLLMTLFEE